jgi:hypothetical protein
MPIIKQFLANRAAVAASAVLLPFVGIFVFLLLRYLFLLRLVGESLDWPGLLLPVLAGWLVLLVGRVRPVWLKWLAAVLYLPVVGILALLFYLEVYSEFFGPWLRLF